MSKITNLKDEVWKNVKGFESSYQVSNKGRVKSLERQVPGKLNSVRTIHERLLSDRDNGRGYRVLELYDGEKRHFKKVHVLVAEAFIPNPLNKPEVNHIDGDKTNNNLENLEWATTKENCTHRQANNLGNTEAARQAHMKSVEMYDLNTGDTIRTFESAAEAGLFMKCRKDSIGRVCRGERKSFKGYGWRFKK